MAICKVWNDSIKKLFFFQQCFRALIPSTCFILLIFLEIGMRKAAANADIAAALFFIETLSKRDHEVHPTSLITCNFFGKLELIGVQH